MSYSTDPQAQLIITSTISSNGSVVDITSPNSAVSIVQATGTWVGTLEVQGSNDGVNWQRVNSISSVNNLLKEEIDENAVYTAATNGYSELRIVSTSWTSGTVNLTVHGSDSSSLNTSLSLNVGATDGTLIGNDGDKHKSSDYGTDPQGNFVSKPISGVVTSNSTSTPLTAGATFTGDFVSCEKYNNISVSILTDQFSAIDGAVIEFSTDGTVGGILRKIKTTIMPTADGLYFAVPCEGKFFRVVYTNGATNQTVFEVETELKIETIGQSTLPLIASLEDTNSVPVNRAIITGKSTDGTYSNQRASGVSTSNTTSTPLGANATYTGGFEDILGYSNITIVVKSDVDSATDGLTIEWSTDGVNVVDTDSYKITGGSGKNFSFGAISRYMRVVYENGDVAQTDFDLQTILHITRTKPSTHRINDSINGQNDAELVKSVITGQNPNGQFVNKSLTGEVSDQSSTSLLLAGQSFVGAITRCADYIGVDVTIRSDQTSATDGLKIEFFNDAAGLELAREVKFTYNVTNGGSHFNIPVQASYFRISYTNGTTDQTRLVLATRLNDTAKLSTIAPISEPIIDTLLGLLTRSVLVGQNPNTGGFENAGVKNGRVQVEAIDVPQPLSDRFQEYALNGGSREMNVNGSGTSVTFEVTADATKDLVVDDLTFQAFSSGIKIDKFLGLNNELTNGILVEVKSEDTVFVFRSIRNTTEFNSIFAQGPGQAFELVFASGADSMVAKFGPTSPFLLKKQGTYGTDDYIRVIVRDNLSSINRLRFLASGRVGEL